MDLSMKKIKPGKPRMVPSPGGRPASPLLVHRVVVDDEEDHADSHEEEEINLYFQQEITVDEDSILKFGQDSREGSENEDEDEIRPFEEAWIEEDEEEAGLYMKEDPFDEGHAKVKSKNSPAEGFALHKGENSLGKPKLIEDIQTSSKIVAKSNLTERISQESEPIGKGLPDSSGDQTEFKCSVCEKIFSTKFRLQRHFGIHLGIKPFKCSECEKSFSQKKHLVEHQYNHTGVKPFLCTECGKTFSTKNYLEVHQRMHSGSNLFTCPECGKSFTKQNNLVVHQLIHTGDKPFTCSDCGKSFSTTSYLKVHQRIHYGSNMFPCPDCGKSFNKKNNLVKHQLIHTGAKPFVCTECGKSYRQKTNLVKHQRLHS